ncbi:MAG TPA: nuclear transport factor 2 family protein, partial [Thermoanaerobaculia bacterium]
MSTKAKVLAKLDDEWSTAAVARDVDRVASFYAEDAIAYPPGEPVAVGKAAAKKVWAAYFSDPSFSISWKTLRA